MNAKTLRNVIVRLVILAAVLGAGGWAWTAWNQRSVKTLDERYQIEEVAKGDIIQTVTANGTLNPVVLVNVGTQVSGTVRKLYADFNDKVKDGQILLELDPTLFRAAVEQSRGNVANSEAALRLAQANEKRMRELFGQEYVSRQDLDQAVQAREAAQAQLRVSQGQLARDTANVNYSVIRSPVSGVVVSRQVDIGQTVAASFQTPTLFQIAQDLTRMQINTNVAEADIGKIRTDQEVGFTVDAFPGRQFKGSISQIRLNPIIQQNVVTYNVVVGVSNTDLTLLPGMTAYISVQVDQRTDVLRVPTAALRFRPRDGNGGGATAGAGGASATGAGGSGGSGGGAAKDGRGNGRDGKGRGGPRVHVVRGQELVPVPVQLGITDGKFVEVTGGELKAGDRIALQNRVGDGSKGGGPAAGGAPRVRAF
ncbi:MAG: efflux RND transporter periplasmic adaptor subunit [Burkholderiales bacterium]